MTALLFQQLGVGQFSDVLPLVYGRPHPAPAIGAATRALASASAEGDAMAASVSDRA